MMKTQIGLGVLSIPLVFDTLGLIPGIICMLTIAVITTWSGYIIGVFKLRHPDVYSIDDVGKKLFGRAGHIFFGTAFCLYWIFVSGSGMLSISIAFNALSEHGTCTAVFVAVAAIIGFGLASIQTLAKMTWLAWVGLAGILTSSKLACNQNYQLSLLTIRSLRPYHSSWRSRQAIRRTADGSVDARLQARQQRTRLCSSHCSGVIAYLCIRRHSSFLLDHFGDA